MRERGWQLWWRVLVSNQSSGYQICMHLQGRAVGVFCVIMSGIHFGFSMPFD